MNRALYAGLFGSLLAACYGAVDGAATSGGPPNNPDTSTTPNGSANNSPTGTTPTGGDGGAPTIDTSAPLWCQCRATLDQLCVSCHGSSPTNGAPMPLVTRADLMAPSKSNPSLTAAQLSLERMQSTTSPMPPSPMPHAPAASLAAFDAWIKQGYPPDSCQGFDAGPPIDAGNPYNTPVVCTSGNTWSGGEGSSTMGPGEACIACHKNRGGEAPIFSIAGTVYPTAHEPDDCLGVAGGVQVVITDANGGVHTINTNSSGNFSLRTSIPTPYHAKVVRNGVERAMTASQTNGDCNGCHTQDGTNSAPGRIMAP